jgi:hypothetical protein
MTATLDGLRLRDAETAYTWAAEMAEGRRPATPETLRSLAEHLRRERDRLRARVGGGA